MAFYSTIMLKLRLLDGNEYPSMALALVQMYHNFYNLGPVALPPCGRPKFLVCALLQ